MSKILFFILLLGCSSQLLAQYFTISGKITDSNQQGLPFSSVQVKGTTQGTNANSDGFYSLKLQAGSYELIFQYIGYKKQVEKIIVTDNVSKNMVLNPESYELKEVTVKDGEDPAYAVIRAAIKKRKYYSKEVEAYTCKAYIKADCSGKTRLGSLFGVTNG